MIENAGTEDGEGDERFWPELNHIAPSTRRSSQYKRGERMDAQALAWNKRKFWIIGKKGLLSLLQPELNPLSPAEWPENRGKLAFKIVKANTAVVNSNLFDRSISSEKLHEDVTQ